MKPTTPKVTKGVSAPSTINTSAIRKLRQQRTQLSARQLIEGIQNGDRILLSKAITLIESTRPEHQTIAQEVINKCLPIAQTKSTIRLGITGSPGVGKSTFIENFGQHLINKDKKVAVLAVDPSSQISRGSILGDKTRMLKLAADPEAFIRPSPAGESLGGVARKTRETITLCEAAGFDWIIIETVGVGQSEIAVHSMVDFFLLLLLPGSGDELQGIKKGIVEMADLVAINKADGDNEKKAKQSKRAYRNALHMLPPKPSQWIPQVVTCSGLSGMGIDNIEQLVQDYQQHMQQNQYWQQHRQEQASYWLHETIKQQLLDTFYQNEVIKNALTQQKGEVLQSKVSPFQAAENMIELFKRQLK